MSTGCRAGLRRWLVQLDLERVVGMLAETDGACVAAVRTRRVGAVRWPAGNPAPQRAARRAPHPRRARAGRRHPWDVRRGDRRRARRSALPLSATARDAGARAARHRAARAVASMRRSRCRAKPHCVATKSCQRGGPPPAQPMRQQHGDALHGRHRTRDAPFELVPVGAASRGVRAARAPGVRWSAAARPRSRRTAAAPSPALTPRPSPAASRARAARHQQLRGACGIARSRAGTPPLRCAATGRRACSSPCRGGPRSRSRDRTRPPTRWAARTRSRTLSK